MGLIERLRRRFGETDASVGEYECRACGARFEYRRQVCPECESFRVERAEWPAE